VVSGDSLTSSRDTFFVSISGGDGRSLMPPKGYTIKASRRLRAIPWPACRLKVEAELEARRFCRPAEGGNCCRPRSDGSGRMGTWLGMILVFSHYLIKKEAFYAIVGASAASATTASSPARFERTTSTAPGNCSRRQRMRPSLHARPTVGLKTSRLRGAAPAAAAG
jgi:hypothetical protein